MAPQTWNSRHAFLRTSKCSVKKYTKLNAQNGTWASKAHWARVGLPYASSVQMHRKNVNLQTVAASDWMQAMLAPAIFSNRHLQFFSLRMLGGVVPPTGQTFASSLGTRWDSFNLYKPNIFSWKPHGGPPVLTSLKENCPSCSIGTTTPALPEGRSIIIPQHWCQQT